MKALALGFVLVVAGCAASDLTLGEKKACAALAQAECDKLEACVLDGVGRRYGAAGTCLARRQASCEASAGAHASGTTPGSIEGCTLALADAACGDFERDTIPLCAPAQGQLGENAACAFSSECHSTFCQLVTGTGCGTCQPRTTLGASCATTSCSRGFVCVSSTLTCQAPSAGGAQCSDGEPCGFALTCVTPSGAATGTCEPAGSSVGASCDPAHATGPGCDELRGLACDRATDRCINLTYAGAGQPCGDVSGTTVACDAASVCFGASDTAQGHCQALVREGSACDTGAGPACMAPARCVTGSGAGATTAGTCELPSAQTCG